MNLAKEVLVVAYDSTPQLITTNRQEAEEYCKKFNEKYKALNMRVMTIEEYGWMCREEGYESATEDD